MRFERLSANLWLLCRFAPFAGKPCPIAVLFRGVRGQRFTMDFDVLS
jgi:hypothetical protein